MNKIDPKGSYFAAGQVVNNVAKMGARHRAKDNQVKWSMYVTHVYIATFYICSAFLSFGSFLLGFGSIGCE